MIFADFTDVSTILRAGVYLLAWRGEVVYIGKSKSMYSRIYTHRTLWNSRVRGKQTPSWLAESVKGIRFDEVHIRPCLLEQLDALESQMINLYKPRHNASLKSSDFVTAEVPLQIGKTLIVLNAQRAAPRLERRL